MTVLRIMVPFLLLLTGTAPAFGEDPASGGEPALSGGCGAGEPDAVLWDGSGDPPRLRALLTARGGTFACLEMIHDQYHQAGEELPEGVPGWLSGDGPLHLISTWSTRYLPFQLVLLGGEEAATGPKVVRTLRDPGPVDGAVPGGAATWKKGAPVEADLRTVYAADPVYTRVSRPGDAEAVYVWPDPARDASEIFVERRLQPLDDYRIRLTVTVYNFGAAAVALQPALEVHGWEPPGRSKGGIFSPPPDVLEALCLAGADLNRAPAADLAEDGVMNPTGEASWIGVGGRYFLLAAIARQVPRPGCQLYGEPNGVLTARLSRERMELAGVPPEVSCVPAWFAGPGRILCDDLAEGLGLSTGDLASPAAVERALKAHADLPGVELERVRHFLKGDGRETWVFELYAGPKDITFLKKPDAGIEDS
ncbi:MAG: hypothetical protein FJ098_09035, partial [Deltaproteobacteria bacterium]|nr:hypothetical protein [Deltaproteobacteria bacterium]